MSKHPGTSGLMPVKGSTCGIRPDLDAMDADTGFDFSQAQQLLAAAELQTSNSEPAATEPPQPCGYPQAPINSDKNS